MAPARSKRTKSRHTRPPSTSKDCSATAGLSSTREAHCPVPPPIAKEIRTLQSERLERRASSRDNQLVNHASSAFHNNLETLPVEVVHHILSYLVHPRSRLPGLTEYQSNCDFSKTEQGNIKGREDKTTPPDSHRHFANVFAQAGLHHPFNDLASTSKRCRELVESYCAHLVKSCNKFNLPFPHLEAYGPNSVYPDLSGIVYRRLWLQMAARRCVFCSATLSCYPHSPLRRLMLTCEDCFYAQALTLEEIQRLYHIRDISVLSSNRVRGSPHYEWALRIDVEALALRLYNTRAFHSTHPDDDKRPCEKCCRARIVYGTVERMP